MEIDVVEEKDVVVGSGGVVDDVTAVVGGGVVEVDVGLSSRSSSHDSTRSGVSQHASSTWLKQHQHSLILFTAEQSADGAKGAAV